ncbi:LacI family DNA-binding transcriptional regulator [Paenibacillus sp. FSL P4-0338]|uniref:LacI family DNA-binding transcriptional regulator n=1 Tax=unclassified Paenibacillus TaxID=185978 RepID=UPI0003E24CE3|nr:LacI family DNA-binding transcriptional regulator [Paenibacillus sp. FSL R7-269]ETT32300.1 transcriptional regulator [Paenibacillus sp. FSL R7-269]
MKKAKVTIQDIADALGISRNTASKALNGAESVPPETREKVLSKAAELKYKQFSYMETASSPSEQQGNIALLTSNLPNSSHFGSQLLSGLEKRISTEGYTLSIYFVRENDINAMTLPGNFEPSNVDGIICIEMFNKEYSGLITDLGIPTIFIDCAADIVYPELKADLLLMENEHSMYAMTRKLMDLGVRSFGFVGDYNHCRSFHERWTGFNRALSAAGIPLNPESCIAGQDKDYLLEANWMDQQMEALGQWPSAFICANDFIAISVMKSLKNRGVKVPEQVAVCGFDDASESRVIEPHLSTVHIYSSHMGIVSAEMLLSRIKDPARPYQVTHVATDVLFRDSTPVPN